MQTIRNHLLFAVLSLLVQGCSTSRMAVRIMDDIFAEAAVAVEEEKDIELAKPAVLSTTKLLEGLLRSDPYNITINTLTMKSLFFTSYVFIETGFEKYQYTDVEKALPFKKRATEVYSRAIRYGDRIFKEECSDFPGLEESTNEQFKECLEELGDDELEMAFWMSFGWGKLIFLNMDKPRYIAHLTKLLYVMNRVEKENPDIFFGALNIFYGTYYGSRSKMLGGDPAKSLMYFEKAIKMNEGKNLMAHLFKAQYYARQVQDEDLFKKELNHILNYDAKQNPRLNLINSVSKEKAKVLLLQTEEIF